MSLRTLAPLAPPPLSHRSAVARVPVPLLAIALVVLAGPLTGLATGCNRASTYTLDPGEEAVVTFLDSDYTTAELLSVEGIGLEGVTEADFEAALRAELLDVTMTAACDYDGADNCFPFTAAGSRWIGARVAARNGTLVSGASEGSLRDYLVVCRGPIDAGATPALVAKNDVNPAVCQDTTMCIGDLEACDPRVELMVAGTWICFFAVSPLCLTDSPGCSPCFDDAMDEPTGGDLRIIVN